MTKCEKIPQRLCGPAGCGFVPGPEQCHDEVKTVVQDLPQEECDLTPQRKCNCNAMICSSSILCFEVLM